MPDNAPPHVSAAVGAARRAPSETSTEGPGRVPLPPGVATPYPLQAVPRWTQCPPPGTDVREPNARNLAYGLTFPSALATPAIAQSVALFILDVHGLDERLLDTALVLVHELASYACRFTGAGEHIHLGLGHSGGALQVTVFDTHAVHAHPRIAAVCDDRRRTALARIPALVEDHHGSWGFGSAHYPSAGTCTWATLGPAGPVRAA